MKCPECNKNNVVKNGRIHNGKKRYLCRRCGRQFIRNPQKKKIPQKTWDEIDRVLIDPKFRVIKRSRVLQIIKEEKHISLPWLYHHLKKLKKKYIGLNY